jgi:hypothetical protein
MEVEVKDAHFLVDLHKCTFYLLIKMLENNNEKTKCVFEYKGKGKVKVYILVREMLHFKSNPTPLCAH